LQSTSAATEISPGEDDTSTVTGHRSLESSLFPCIVDESNASQSSNEIAIAAAIAAANAVISQAITTTATTVDVQQPKSSPSAFTVASERERDSDKLSDLEWLTEEQRAKIASREAHEKECEPEKQKHSTSTFFRSVAIPSLLPSFSAVNPPVAVLKESILEESASPVHPPLNSVSTNASSQASVSSSGYKNITIHLLF
jgi:zona occludens toxin (predicted ATPase)